MSFLPCTLCMLVSTQHSLIALWIIHHTLFAGKSAIALQHTAVEPGCVLGYISPGGSKEGPQHRGIGINLIAVS